MWRANPIPAFPARPSWRASIHPWQHFRWWAVIPRLANLVIPPVCCPCCMCQCPGISDRQSVLLVSRKGVRAFSIMLPSQCFLVSLQALVLHTLFTAVYVLLSVRWGLSLFKDSANFLRLEVKFQIPWPLSHRDLSGRRLWHNPQVSSQYHLLLGTALPADICKSP